jgi:hypothetical protein
MIVNIGSLKFSDRFARSKSLLGRVCYSYVFITNSKPDSSITLTAAEVGVLVCTALSNVPAFNYRLGKESLASVWRAMAQAVVVHLCQE